MFQKFKAVLFCFTLLLYGCSDNSQDEIPQPAQEELYFSYKANDDTSESDDWIIIHNSNGELLDYRAFEKNDFLEFKTKSPLLTDKISVSVFSVYESYGKKNHFIKTTTAVDKGIVWDFEQEPIIEPITSSSIGSFDFKLTNFPKTELLNISNKGGDINGSLSGVGAGGSWTYSGSDFTLYENNDYLFTIAQGTSDSKYYYAENLNDGDVITVEYNQFIPFDSYLSINLPPDSSYFLLLLGFEDDQNYTLGDGYVLSKIFPFDNNSINQNPLRVGYLNNLDRYITTFDVYLEGYTYNYKKYGAKPNEIVIPEDPTFSIGDNSLENFRFSTSLDFNQYTSIWSNNTEEVSSNWYVESGSNSYHKIGKIPEELVQKYPDFNINSLEYNKTHLTLSPEESITFYE